MFSGFVLAVGYRFFYELHHMLCLRSGKKLQQSKLIVVGSFRTGGAGKTPVTIALAGKYVAEGKTVAVLVHKVACDEEILLKRKLPGCNIIRTPNRYRTAHEIDGSVDVIICDDGFEDTRLQPDETILLDWGDPCELMHDLWPNGGCRSLLRDHPNITRTIKMGSPDSEDYVFRIENIIPFSSWQHKSATIGVDSISNYLTGVIACGLGDSERFAYDVDAYLKRRHAECKITDAYFRPDHDKNFAETVRTIAESSPGNAIIMSEKDACRLQDSDADACKNVLVAIQSVDFGIL